MSDIDTKRVVGRPAAAPSGAVTAARRTARGGGSHFMSRYALPMLGLLLIIIFSLILRDTFPTSRTVSSILSDQSTVAMLALAEMLVVAVGHYDLSVGYSLGLLELVSIGLLYRDHLAWGPIVLIVLLAGGVIGLVNGLLVTVAKIDSFIATLGLGYFLYGIDNWYSQGQQVIGAGFPKPFADLNAARLLGVPAPAIYVLVLAVALWIAMEFTPTGRYMYAIGSNQRAAELSGVKVRRFTLAAFVVAGVIVAAAAVVLAAKLQVGESDVGPEFLLPAFVGSMLGATAIRPGRVNVWGTIIAVLVLGIGIAGLEQLGGAFFVDPMFNGGTLIAAVGAAGFAARRRLARRKNEETLARATATPIQSPSTTAHEGGER
jgi:ribose transport system permease protein